MGDEDLSQEELDARYHRRADNFATFPGMEKLNEKDQKQLNSNEHNSENLEDNIMHGPSIMDTTDDDPRNIDKAFENFITRNSNNGSNDKKHTVTVPNKYNFDFEPVELSQLKKNSRFFLVNNYQENKNNLNQFNSYMSNSQIRRANSQLEYITSKVKKYGIPYVFMPGVKTEKYEQFIDCYNTLRNISLAKFLKAQKPNMVVKPKEKSIIESYNSTFTSGVNIAEKSGEETYTTPKKTYMRLVKSKKIA